MFKIFISIVVLSCLSACAAVDFGSPDIYQRYDVQHAGTIEAATVVSVRTITIDSGSDNSGLSSLLSAGLALSSAPARSAAVMAAISPVQLPARVPGSLPRRYRRSCSVTQASRS